MLLASLTLAVSVVGVVLIPVVILAYKVIRKGTIIEMNQNVLIEDIRKLVLDKDKTHSEIIAQMRDDRQATDKRLRWLEQNLWRRNA